MSLYILYKRVHLSRSPSEAFFFSPPGWLDHPGEGAVHECDAVVRPHSALPRHPTPPPSSSCAQEQSLHRQAPLKPDQTKLDLSQARMSSGSMCSPIQEPHHGFYILMKSPHCHFSSKSSFVCLFMLSGFLPLFSVLVTCLNIHPVLSCTTWWADSQSLAVCQIREEQNSIYTL